MSVTIPKRLDPVEQGDETIKSCSDIRNYIEDGGREIFVDMSNMTDFTLAGVIYLAACIDSKKRENHQIVSSVKGNFPDDEAVASEFVESGFFHGFKTNIKSLPPPKASWTRARFRKVASIKAAELVEFSEEHVQLTKLQKNAISQNLVECMTNTHNHARGRELDPSKNEGAEQWIAGVMCKDNEAFFAFVDLGVGICNSASVMSYFDKIKNIMVNYGQEKLVRDVFKGVLGSSTELKGRGLGLPRMMRDAKYGYLENLKIRTGKVEGDIVKMQFRETKSEMRGTIITWSASEVGGQ